jgi:hypothetical protein
MSRVSVLSMVISSGALWMSAFASFATDVPNAPASPAPAAAAAPGASPAAQPEPEAQIPFANKGAIWSWQVVDNKTVLIQGRGRQWYKATLMGNCHNLVFKDTLAFLPNPSGTFDKFSQIRVRGQVCPLTSLVKTTAPSTKKKPADAAKPAAPASSSLTAP